MMFWRLNSCPAAFTAVTASIHSGHQEVQITELTRVEKVTRKMHADGDMKQPPITHRQFLLNYGVPTDCQSDPPEKS
ncbi:hypothetical protein ACFL5B_00535 [Candidatus Latescibacterota bacterium]